MISGENIKPYLESFAKRFPRQVMDRLEEGSRVQKSLGLDYKVDNPNIDQRLGEFPKGAVPYGKIHRALRISQRKELYDLFQDSREIEFSKAFEAGVGECLEKAILVQLSAQRGRDAFLINGALTEEEGFSDAHAYNVVFREGKPFLIDAENPLAKDSKGKITRPCIVPIVGIEGEYAQFVLPQGQVDRWTYSIV